MNRKQRKILDKATDVYARKGCPRCGGYDTFAATIARPSGKHLSICKSCVTAADDVVGLTAPNPQVSRNETIDGLTLGPAGVEPDSAAADDRDWFKQHPGEVIRNRDWQGPNAQPGCKIAVYQVAEGARARLTVPGDADPMTVAAMFADVGMSEAHDAMQQDRVAAKH